MSGGKGASGFSPMTMLVLALVGVISVAGLGVLSAYAPELRKGDDGGGHALSRSSIGYAALVRLLTLSGEPVLTSRGPLPPTAEGGLLVFTPQPGMSAKSLRPVLTARCRPPPRAACWCSRRSRACRPRACGAWGRKVRTGGAAQVAGRARSARIAAGPTLDAFPAEDSLSVLPDKLRKSLVLKTTHGDRTLRLARPNGQAIGGPVRMHEPRALSGRAGRR
jgi:hypothetical protein